MEIVLADLAPDPEPGSTGVIVVVVLGVVVVVAAAIVLVVWLRGRARP
jgi:hypothetical protein